MKRTRSGSPGGGGPNRRKPASRKRYQPGHLRGQDLCEVGARSHGEQLGPDAILHRVPQDHWPVRQMGRGLSSALHQWERAGEAECTGNSGVIGARRSLAVRPHQRDPGRRHQSGVAGNEWGGERGFGAAGHEGHGRGRQRTMDEKVTEGQLRAAAAGALGIRCGHDSEAVVRTPARRQGGIYPDQARASVTCLSQLLRGEYPDGIGHGGAGGESDGSVVCATGTVGIPGRTSGAGPASILARGQPLGSGERHGGSRGAKSWVLIQTQAERECEEADRTNLPERGLGRGGATMGGGRGRVAGGRMGRGGAGGGGRGDVLRLSGWRRERRVVVLRRPLRSKPVGEAETVGKKKSKRKGAKQLTLDLPELTYQGTQYEYAVLVTSLTDEVRSVAQLYRDRGDAENNFDELKNQWGWAGFTTQDRKRCQIMGRIIALVYNWWTIFMRLGIPDKHAEAITSRPLALHGIARQTRHGNQTTVEITSTHAKASQIAEILTKVSGFLRRIRTTAEQ